MLAKVIDEKSLFYGLILKVEERVELRYFCPSDCEYFRPEQVEIIKK